jgi:hypothetical protein
MDDEEIRDELGEELGDDEILPKTSKKDDSLLADDGDIADDADDEEDYSDDEE